MNKKLYLISHVSYLMSVLLFAALGFCTIRDGEARHARDLDGILPDDVGVDATALHDDRLEQLRLQSATPAPAPAREPLVSS